MAAKVRVYWVKEGTDDHLVEAASQAQAVRHVVSDRFQVVIASPRNVAQLMATGVRLEIAGADNEP